MTILALGGRGNPTPELMRHQLHAIANAENRGTHLPECATHHRCFWVVDTSRPAGKNDSAGIETANSLHRQLVRVDLTVDMALSDAPRDELRVLRAEVEDDHYFAWAFRAHRRYSPPVMMFMGRLELQA